MMEGKKLEQMMTTSNKTKDNGSNRAVAHLKSKPRKFNVRHQEGLWGKKKQKILIRWFDQRTRNYV